MSRTPRATSPHDLLRQAPGGSFTARARGLLAAEFLLLHSSGWEFGWLRMRGATGAELHIGECVAQFEKSERGYRMVADGEEVLVATPKGRSAGELEIYCGGRSYNAQADLLRNLAIASNLESGERAVRLSGGLLGRGYEALLATGDEWALLVAAFLLWYVAANRRRAYRKGDPARGAAI